MRVIPGILYVQGIPKDVLVAKPNGVVVVIVRVSPLAQRAKATTTRLGTKVLATAMVRTVATHEPDRLAVAAEIVVPVGKLLPLTSPTNAENPLGVAPVGVKTVFANVGVPPAKIMVV